MIYKLTIVGLATLLATTQAGLVQSSVQEQVSQKHAKHDHQIVKAESESGQVAGSPGSIQNVMLGFWGDWKQMKEVPLPGYFACGA